MEKILYVEILEHDDTGLFAAISRELPGLMVHDYSIDEIERRLPAVIKDLLEAQGVAVESVTAMRDERRAAAQLEPPAFIANAVLSRVAA